MSDVSKKLEGILTKIRSKELKDLWKNIYESSNISEEEKEKVALEWRSELKIEFNILKNRIGSMPFSGEDAGVIFRDVEEYERKLQKYINKLNSVIEKANKGVTINEANHLLEELS